MTDPIRAALERLHQYAEIFPEHDTDSIVARAQAALSADEPAVPDGREPAALAGEPSDEELLGLMHQSWRDDLAKVSRLADLEAGTAAGVLRVTHNHDVVRFARAVLARWGQPARAPRQQEYPRKS